MGKLGRCCFIFILLALSCSASAARPVVHVMVYGATGDIRTNVIRRLNSLAENYLSSNSPKAMYYLQHEAKTTVYKAIAPFGYMEANVKQQIEQKNKAWYFTYHINLGKPTIITKVNIKISGPGQYSSAFTSTVNQFAPQKGKILDIKTYNNFLNQLTIQANRYGYFQAKMQRRQILVSKSNHTAKIIIRYNTGPRSNFGLTYFHKNKLSIGLLQRYLNYCKDQPYQESKVQQLQQDLLNSDYFNTVEVTPKINTNTTTVPIDVGLNLKKAKRYNVGIGYGTDTGPRTTLGVEFRHFNSRGHRLNLNTQLSQVNQGLAAQYLIPGRNPARNHYAFATSYSKQELSIGNSDAKQISASYINKLWGWTQTFSLSYLNEIYNIKSTGTPKINANMIVPSVEWSRHVSDNSLQPSKGYVVSLRLSGAQKGFLSRSSFAQAYLDTHVLYSFFNNGTRLLGRAELGYTQIKNLEDLPLSLQLLAGGSQSVRGYNFRSIGPGKIMRVTSGELQQRVYKDFYVGGFYDAGMVSNKIADGRIYQSAGPSLMWLSPVGMIQLSVARQLGSDLKHNKWGFDFSLGSAI